MIIGVATIIVFQQLHKKIINVYVYNLGGNITHCLTPLAIIIIMFITYTKRYNIFIQTTV